MKTFLSEQVYCYLMRVSYYTSCSSVQSQSPASVDESFPVSSGLLNLVVVLVNDVEQLGLEKERHTVSVTQKERYQQEGVVINSIRR